MADTYWPVFDLVVRTSRLELRYPDDVLLTELATLSGQGVHDPEFMPFSEPWTTAPPGQIEPNTLKFFWKLRSEWTPEQWSLSMVVREGGVVKGTQGMSATRFSSSRTVRTGSWLGKAYQGQGIGKEMRTAILYLAFVGLGAERAESAAFDDNLASIGVSRAVGYADNGDEILKRGDATGRGVRFLMNREAWMRSPVGQRTDINIEGLEACLPMFGIEPAPTGSGSPERVSVGPTG